MVGVHQRLESTGRPTRDEAAGGDVDSPSTDRTLAHTTIPCNAGTTKEEMAQPAFQGLAALNFPELHEESIPELNFFRACHKMMTVRMSMGYRALMN